MLRKDEVHCYSLFLDGTIARNDFEESLEFLKVEIVEDFTEVFSTELPKTLPRETCVDHHIDLVPGTKGFSRVPYTLSKFETDEVEKVVHEPLS